MINRTNATYTAIYEPLIDTSERDMKQDPADHINVRTVGMMWWAYHAEAGNNCKEIQFIVF